MSKISFLLGAAAGYVLGARAGRQRYEQIRSGAAKAEGAAVKAEETQPQISASERAILERLQARRQEIEARQREIDAGMFLPCCSRPLSDLVIER